MGAILPGFAYPYHKVSLLIYDFTHILFRSLYNLCGKSLDAGLACCGRVLPDTVTDIECGVTIVIGLERDMTPAVPLQ